MSPLALLLRTSGSGRPYSERRDLERRGLPAEAGFDDGVAGIEPAGDRVERRR
jgi:hypothetical protein